MTKVHHAVVCKPGEETRLDFLHDFDSDNQMNFSFCNSLSLEKLTQAYPKEVLESFKPPEPVCVKASLSARSS